MILTGEGIVVPRILRTLAQDLITQLIPSMVRNYHYIYITGKFTMRNEMRFIFLNARLLSLNNWCF